MTYHVPKITWYTIMKNMFNHLSNDISIRPSFCFDKRKEMETTLLVLEPFTFSKQVPVYLLFPLFEPG